MSNTRLHRIPIPPSTWDEFVSEKKKPDLRFNKQDDPELEELIKIRNAVRNKHLSYIKRGEVPDEDYLDKLREEMLLKYLEKHQ